MKRAARFFAKVESGDGHLLIYDDIGPGFFTEGVTAKSVQESMDSMKSEGAKNLHVYINSPGGDVFEGNAILNVIARWAGRKIVHIDGLAASMASVIAMVGDSIEIAANGMVMIHEPWGLAVGGAEHMRERANLLDTLAENILGTYERRTKQTRADVAKWMAEETWMDAETAVARGFADSISAPASEDASASADQWPLLAQFKRAPERAARLLAHCSIRPVNPAACAAQPPPQAALTEEEPHMDPKELAAMLKTAAEEGAKSAIASLPKPEPVAPVAVAVAAGPAADLASDLTGGNKAPNVTAFATPRALKGREDRSDESATPAARRALPLARLACAVSVAKDRGMPVADAAEMLGFRRTAEVINASAMSVGASDAGGTFVPTAVQQGFIDMLDHEPGATSLIPAGNKIQSDKPTIQWPTVTSGASGAWVGENPATESLEALGTGAKTMTAKKQRIEMLLSRELIRAAGNIDQIVLAKMLLRSKQLDDLAMVEGTGAVNEPTGLDARVLTANTAAMTASPDYENAHIDLLYMLKKLANAKVPTAAGRAFIMSTQHRYGLAGYMNPAGNAYPYADEMARGTLMGHPFFDSTLFSTAKVRCFAPGEMLQFTQLEMLLESDSKYASLDQTVIRLWRKVDFALMHNDAVSIKTAVTWGA